MIAAIISILSVTFFVAGSMVFYASASVMSEMALTDPVS